jgi:acyl carrier protein
MADTTEAAVTQKLFDFICESFPHAKRETLKPEDALLDAGVVDSLGLLEIVEFMEAEYGISVTLADMLPENFGSIAAMAGFVHRAAAPA